MRTDSQSKTSKDKSYLAVSFPCNQSVLQHKHMHPHTRSSHASFRVMYASFHVYNTHTHSLTRALSLSFRPSAQSRCIPRNGRLTARTPESTRHELYSLPCNGHEFYSLPYNGRFHAMDASFHERHDLNVANSIASFDTRHTCSYTIHTTFHDLYHLNFTDPMI